MRELLKYTLLVSVVLTIPILPFLGFGPWLEERIERQLQDQLPPAVVAVSVIGLLATDVFLPIPSSVVSTMAGNSLGFVAGTAASWLGMTLGAVFGFALARTLGRPLALRFAGEEDLARIDAAGSRFGPLVLVLARPIPVLAEASILFLGATRLGWRPFLLATALSNLGIAAVYAALGNLAQLPIALAASIALPLVAATLARRFWPSRSAAAGAPSDGPHDPANAPSISPDRDPS
jgi:uncharacterized membrane protein YdjX (TVP38/TMEM64 family)